MRKFLKVFLNSISDLGVPVTVGALITFVFFAKLHGVEVYLPLAWICCTGVFSIYLYDHLSDIKGTEISSPKDNFWIIQKLKYPLIGISIIAILISFYLILYRLPSKYFIPGGIAFLLVLIYFLLIKFASYKHLSKIKEFLVALTASFTLAGISAWVSETEIQWTLLIAFFLLCFQNILLFSWIDFDNDFKNNKPTLAIDSGIPFIVWVLDIFAVICISLLADLWYSNGFSISLLAFFLMQIQLIIIRILCEKKEPKRVYRFWVDLIFVVPIIALV